MRHVLAAAALTAAAVSGALTPISRPPEPTPRADRFCLTVIVSGLVNQGTPAQCADTPVPLDPFDEGAGVRGVLYVEVYTHYPSRAG